MTTIIIYLVACVLFGAISCFFGRRLYFPIMMLTVFFGIVTLSFSIFEVTTKVAVVTIIVALICALLAKAIYKLGVFLMGCLLARGAGSVHRFSAAAVSGRLAQIYHHRLYAADRLSAPSNGATSSSWPPPPTTAPRSWPLRFILWPLSSATSKAMPFRATEARRSPTSASI